MQPEHRDQRTDLALLRAVTAAAAQILTSPPRRAAALSYLRQRGIDAAGLPPGRLLGYAPPGWTRLVYDLQDEFPDQVLLEAGLARRSSRGNLIDCFRDRVIFAINDSDGQVAGFLGRDLSGDPHAPKYLNSRASALFDKSRLLYGLPEGSTSTPQPRQIVVVEGPLDVLAVAARAHQDGRRDLLPVAAGGTAFTPAHARRVAQLARPTQTPVVIALDGDAPGRAAALPAGERLRALGVEVRVAVLPNGSDPADYLTHPAGTLDTFTAKHAVPLLTVQVEHLIAAQGERMQWIEGRLAAARAVAANLATYPVHHGAAQIGWIAHTLHLDPATFTDELVTAYRSARSVTFEPASSRSPQLEPVRL